MQNKMSTRERPKESNQTSQSHQRPLLPRQTRLLNLTTLESRRSRGDLISYYNIANGLLDVNWLTFTKLMSSISCHGPANAIRGHKKRLFVQLSNCPARMNFLNNRVASSWNNLASTTVNAPTLNSFKARLDKHLALANNTTI